MNGSFNLIDEPWLPVLWMNGETGRIGLREMLARACYVREIASSNPMDRLAVIRFLLSILYWSRGNPSEADHAGPPEALFSGTIEKLESHRDCFDLFGPAIRFLQYPRREGGGSSLPANYLAQEIPTGTNKWHFRHATDKHDGLCPACCAAGLIRLPAFATAGGRGKPPGVNGKPPIYALPVATNLADTLRFSWKPVETLGTPAWIDPEQVLPASGDVPLLLGLTWVPRRVWLGAPGDMVARCIACGRPSRLVKECEFAAIGSTRTGDDGPGRLWQDPHVLRESNAKGERYPLPASDALGSPDASAGQRARILASVIRNRDRFCDRGRPGADGIPPPPVSVWCVGFSTVQNDKYLEAKEWRFTLPATLDDTRASRALDALERWSKADIRKRLAKAIDPEAGNGSRQRAEIPPIAASIRPQLEERALATLEANLDDPERAFDEAARVWPEMMATVAGSIAPGCSTDALRRRRRIAATTPAPPPARDAVRKSGAPSPPKRGGRKARKP